MANDAGSMLNDAVCVRLVEKQRWPARRKAAVATRGAWTLGHVVAVVPPDDHLALLVHEEQTADHRSGTGREEGRSAALAGTAQSDLRGAFVSVLPRSSRGSEALFEKEKHSS